VRRRDIDGVGSNPILLKQSGDTPLTHAYRIAFIGNSLPRRCGIATFTSDLQQAIAASDEVADTAIVAMNDGNAVYDYPASVRCQVHEDDPRQYQSAARFLNEAKFDVVCLQHEFGIFGGEAGARILGLLENLTVPLVTTLHTVLAEPAPAQRRVLQKIADLSATVVVMAEKGRQLLNTVYAIAPDKIEVIPHGIPECPLVEPDAAKRRRGFEARSVILTFGLLSPNKGIETMIEAMPAILESRPDAVYVVLGATHPNLIRHEGEAYRGNLLARAVALGVEEHVVFLDRFVDQATLVDYISMCDVYVTPYLNESQMTSGTLAYSFGVGKAVVSTPYWHARELLADGRGILVPFADSEALGSSIASLLTDDVRRNALRREAYSHSRSMTWQRCAERYLATFARAGRSSHDKLLVLHGEGVPRAGGQVSPQINLGHFLAMCDDTGLFQHAVHSVPDRAHGYCIDDNARALLLACELTVSGHERLSENVTARFAAFIQHAWNPQTRRFRNFLGFDRRWLEDQGSEDSHGRALWALGVCSRNDANPSRRCWASTLFEQALPSVRDFTSPRAWAFTLLGLEAFLSSADRDWQAVEIQHLLADRLLSMLSTVATPDWQWFENELAYDNARLPQALIVTGESTSLRAYTEAGLRALRWLTSMQTSEAGYFRPVGSQSFGARRERPRPFDQQPLEATAAIAAALAAWRADGDLQWRAAAASALEWFFGTNDLGVALIDTRTGSCRDGLHPDRANENNGGESVVSYLLALVDARSLARATGTVVKRPRLKPAAARIH
jgi:glycosyltransferase involved in cell wall biosynthesis